MERLRVFLAWDEALALGIRRWHAPWMTHLMRIATRLGDGSSWLFTGLLMSAGGRPDLGVRLGAGAILATASTQAIKRVAKRTRPSARLPSFTALIENPDVFSFPSGHTAAACAVAIALAGQGHALGALFATLAVAIGLSRVYLGAHFPLDVFVGALMGAASGVISRYFF